MAFEKMLRFTYEGNIQYFCVFVLFKGDTFLVKTDKPKIPKLFFKLIEFIILFAACKNILHLLIK